MLELVDVSVSYGQVEALRGISLEVEPGSITSLIGANGAGKSTCLRAVSGLVPLAGGTIHFNGVRVDTLKADRVAGLGIAHVPERGRLFPRMTVYQNLQTGAYLRRYRAAVKKDIEGVFEQFPILGQRRSQIARTLSGGEQQMLALSRARMARPALYMFDEPSLGLAPIIVSQVADQILKLRDDGATIVLVEQNARLVLRMSQRGYVLADGRVILSGTSDSLLRNPDVQHAYLGAT